MLQRKFCYAKASSLISGGTPLTQVPLDEWETGKAIGLRLNATVLIHRLLVDGHACS